MLHLDDEDWEIVQKILRDWDAGVKVIAFGSRVHGRHLRKFSDLDLAVWPASPLDWRRIAKLKDAFEYSDLPIRVDVLDLSEVSDEFREIVLKEFLVVQEPGAAISAAP
jgi:predicted nucleotidyltransferase